MSHRVNIVIPTYNRAQLVGRAVEAALGQSHPDCFVTVIDDCSADDTLAELSNLIDHARFRCVALANNVGTAQAKNVGIALNDCPYITFHDSDDVPHRDKIARQLDAATTHDVRANPILNWSLCSVTPDTPLPVDLVVSEHELVLTNGERHHMRRALSLVDDAFPNLQMAAGVPGDWILINCGLFRADVFDRLGGFSRGIEEDRDLRNRLIFNGGIVWLVPEVLLEKFECDDALTVAASTNYDSEQRRADRARIWKIADRFHRGIVPEPVPIDLRDVGLLGQSSPLCCQTRCKAPRAKHTLSGNSRIVSASRRA